MLPRTGEVLPDHLGLRTDGRRLPDSDVNIRGPVRALVLPTSYGERPPDWTPEEVAYHLIGPYDEHPSDHPSAIAPHLHSESNGLLRLDASVFPSMIVPREPPEDFFDDREAMRNLAERVIRGWSGRVNLASFNNDGPDGIPMSEDDDGALDLVIITVETDEKMGAFHGRSDLEIEVGRERDLTVAIGSFLVLGTPRNRPLEESTGQGISLVLSAMGLDYDILYSSEDFPTVMTPLARLKLGWIDAAWTHVSGIYTLADEEALVTPVMDTSDGRAFWIMERVGDQVLLLRVVRDPDGTFEITSEALHEAGEPDAIVSLTRTQGTLGPRVRLTWQEGEFFAHVALSESAVRHDEPSEDDEDRVRIGPGR